MSQFKTTLREVMDHGPCYDPRQRGLLPADFGVDAEIDLERIIGAVPVKDAIWCLRAFPDHASLWRHFSVDCAERVKDRMTDDRSLNALDVARRHAQGLADDAELAAAGEAAIEAWAAARAARAAGAAAEAAAWAHERTWQKERLLFLVRQGYWTPVKEELCV